MTKLSLNKAASYAGKAKADILKALKSNDPNKKLSGEKNERGHWEIETSELDRVFPKKNATSVKTRPPNRSATPDKSPDTSTLELEVQALRQEKITNLENQIRDAKNQLEDMKTERDDWKRQAQQLALASPDKKRGLWGRLFSS